MMHTYLATARARRWIAQRKRNTDNPLSNRGDRLLFLTALVLLALLLGGVL